MTTLIDNRYKTEQYQDFIARLYKKRKKENIQTANITFQVTDQCNLKCSYCYQKQKNNNVMPLSIAKQFIDLLLIPNKNTKKYLNSLNSKAVIIEFIGGEPLLQIELIEQICDYFIQKCIELNHPWQYNYMFSMTTNGTLYFNKNVQHFIQRFKNHLSMSITLDGNKELHDSCRCYPNGQGSYDQVIKAIHYHKNINHLDPGCKLTLSPYNIQYTFNALKNFLEEKYQHINLNCCYEKGWNYSHANILYNELKKISNFIIENNYTDVYISMFRYESFKPKKRTDSDNWCGGNGKMIAVDYKGNIFPCLRYMESSLGNDAPPLIIGNVEDGIMTLPEHIKNAKMCQSVNRLTQSTEECINCPIAEGCSWCQAYNYQDSHGDINHRATYICCMHKATSLANVYYWNLYFRMNNLPYRFKMWLPKEEALKIIDEEEYDLLLKLSSPLI